MRSILALSLFLAPCAAASAASSHHGQRHSAVRAEHGSMSHHAPAADYRPARAVQPAPQYGQPSPYDNRYPNWGGM